MESARRSRRFVSVESDKKPFAINTKKIRVKNKRISNNIKVIFSKRESISYRLGLVYMGFEAIKAKEINYLIISSYEKI